ncbi:cytochrome c oxidase subunit II [Runella aurantiaca]|uniref:Cytochrome c oxidase subunit 2 n=1 Tax=Runella aurantiaca TaxID=2282308 RepID=A0A369I3B2_9BACT|nr:cytochrome c oxidase subunit II [Runella aurantiaca]RDB04048.1 cytochrome c oxidase subunit II [Runella aurantiaca]
MVYLVGLLLLVLLGVAIAIAAKLQKVMGSVQSNTEADAPVPNNKINGAMWMFFLIAGTVGAVWSYLSARNYFLPEASSPHGRETDSQFWLDMSLLTIAFFIVNFLLFFFAWKYQYKKGYKATFYPENHKLELIWTAIPAVIMAVLVFLGFRSWTQIMSDAPADAQVIEIMGKQFGWIVRYPGIQDNKLGNYNFKLITSDNEMGVDYSDEASMDDFINPSEMHVEVGKPVSLKIRARDVLHSVFIPHMRVKMDAVPGMPTKFWFTPDKSTEQMRAELGNPNFDYEIACTEVCGRGHFAMRLRLIVEDKASVDAWKQQQKPLLSTILEADPKFISKIPEKLRAKAMDYAPYVEEVDSTTAATGSAAAATSSLR